MFAALAAVVFAVRRAFAAGPGDSAVLVHSGPPGLITPNMTKTLFPPHRPLVARNFIPAPVCNLALPATFNIAAAVT